MVGSCGSNEVREVDGRQGNDLVARRTTHFLFERTASIAGAGANRPFITRVRGNDAVILRVPLRVLLATLGEEEQHVVRIKLCRSRSHVLSTTGASGYHHHPPAS